jgi:outer membrane protein assembly factor BamB
MGRSLLPAVLLLLATGSLPAADPGSRAPVPGESAGTGRRLDAADRLAADQQYAAAAAEYARISDEAGDDLVAVGPHVVLPARRLCFLRLAALPPESLRAYRNRVDAPAQKWLEQGTADNDPRPLQRLVDEAFCSRHTDTALDRLGDLAFERGQFYEAERWWRMLALPASEAARGARPAPWSKSANPGPTVDLLYPDPRGDVAQVRAKQVLALLFRGERAAAVAELEAFRALHPKAEGHLAGRRGNYADTLQALSRRKLTAEPADDAWPTFAGAQSRGAVLPTERGDPNRLNRLVAHGPAWRYQIDLRRLVTGDWVVPPERDLRPGGRPAAAPLSTVDRARRLAYHPVILGQQVLVADARGVTALDTATGASQTWQLKADDARDPALGAQTPAPPDLRYTLTAAEGRVYARLGVQAPPPPKPGAEPDSFIVCLEFAEPGHKFREVWRRPAEPPGKGSRPIFEGAPVVRDGLLYVAATRVESGSQVSEVRCYAADSDAPPRWKQDVVSSRDLSDAVSNREPSAAARYRHLLLTLAGRHVVYASHAGAVVALDARTGRRAWAFCYPSSVPTTPGGNPVLRDLAPAVYAAGRLYIAPVDYDRLLCLDPETGNLLWELPRVEVVHLLGVGSGLLIFTTPKGIRAVRADDGADAWQIPDGPDGLATHGRGFLAGDIVFWPTFSNGIQVLGQADGRPPLDLIPGPLSLHNVTPGNMAYAGGILAVADDRGLKVYLAPDQRVDAVEPPARALDGLARLALAQAEAGRPAAALATWQEVLADKGLRQGVLRDGRGLPQIAGTVAAEHIDELLRDHGRTIFAPTEDRARALLASAKGDVAALERLAATYPNAAAAGTALLQAGKLHEASCRWGAAAHAYRRLGQLNVTGDEGSAARAGLARAVEHECKCGVAVGGLRDLTPPLTRLWDKEERLLPSSDLRQGAELFLVRGTALVCREASTGAERWSRPVAGSPSWAGRHAATVVAAGPDHVQAYALSDGTPLWRFPAPDAAAFRDPRLSAFQLAGGRLFCLQGECRLLTLDVESGRVLWQCWAPAARLGADVAGARFSPHYLAAADRLLIQSAGRSRLLDARTGAMVRDRLTEAILWPQPPQPLDGGGIAVIDGRRRVSALDLATGKVAWSHELPRWPSLSGEPPLLFSDRGSLLVSVPRNDGYWLQRLDPATGQALWEAEAPLGPDRIDPGSVVLDRGGVYYVSRNVVVGRALDGGRTLWTAGAALPGPAGRWFLRRVGAALLAWPAEATRTKFHSRWLTASLELAVTIPPEDRTGQGVPVLLLDPQDGTVLQRLNFVPPVPRAQGRFAADEELAAVPRLFTERAAADGPVAQLTRAGLVVGWDSKSWALRPQQ